MSDYKKQEWSISYKRIGVVLFAFALGVIFSLLLSNTQTTNPTTLTTTELIGTVCDYTWKIIRTICN
jgi:hypothetical protein